MAQKSCDSSDQVGFFILLLRGETSTPSLFQCPAWLTSAFASEGHFREEINPGNYYGGKKWGGTEVKETLQ